MRRTALVMCALALWLATGCGDESNSEQLAVVVPREGSVLLRLDLGTDGVTERLGWFTRLGSFAPLSDAPDGKPVDSLAVKTDTGKASVRLYWTEKDAGRCSTVQADWIYTEDQIVSHKIRVCLAGGE